MLLKLKGIIDQAMMRRRDDFIQPLSLISFFVMLGVKAFTALVFVFLVLAVGLNQQNIFLLEVPVDSSVTTPVETPEETTVPGFEIASAPLPVLEFGVALDFDATPIPPTQTNTATSAPTIAFTVTQSATNTLAPTETLTPTSTHTSTAIATATETMVSTETATATATLVIIASPTSTPRVLVSPTPKASATIKPTTTPTTLAANTPSGNFTAALVPSPLEGISVSELSEIISQPFILPPAGEDSGHHGVDFAFWQRGDLASIEGVPVLSVFSGKVASAYSKIRPPYGYMVLVETPLTSLPTEVMDAIKMPEESQVPTNPSNRLTCPTGFADWWSTDSQSLYVLYGHLRDVPAVKLGQTVKTGELLGYVGNTGSSSNPHLHLEMRIGPSNAIFNSMGHYDPSTTDQERHNYCSWRISGTFELFDPMVLYGGTTSY